MFSIEFTVDKEEFVVRTFFELTFNKFEFDVKEFEFVPLKVDFPNFFGDAFFDISFFVLDFVIKSFFGILKST